MSAFWILFTVLISWELGVSLGVITDSDDVLGSITDPETTTARHPKTTTIAPNCTCVEYYLCNVDDGTLNTGGEDLIDPRVGLKRCKDGEVCCEKLKGPTELSTTSPVTSTTTESSTKPPTESTTTATPPKSPSEATTTTESSKSQFTHTVCGKRNPAGIADKVTVPDTVTQFGEFPWMAAILKRKTSENDTGNVFICGGSLISPKVILTAAHCVYGKSPSSIKVRLGEWDTQNADEPYPDVNAYVSKIIIHKKFTPKTLYNDIALLILKEEVKLAPNIDTVCLSPNNFDFNGKRCFVTGWGKNVFGQKGVFQTIMKKIEIPIVPNPTCQQELRTTKLGSYFRLDDSFVCAGGEPEKDSCQGDGGSPLVCQFPNSPYYIQYGIVSWGIGCGGDYPGVYVDLAHFKFWIADQFTKARLDSSYFKS